MGYTEDVVARDGRALEFAAEADKNNNKNTNKRKNNTQKEVSKESMQQ